MEVVYHRYRRVGAVCVDCHTGIDIPKNAPDVVRQKRERQWIPRDPKDLARDRSPGERGVSSKIDKK